MKGKYLHRIGVLMLAVVLAPGAVALLSSTTVQAQGRVVIVRPYRPFFRPWGWGYRPYGWGGYPYYYGYNGQYVFSNPERATDQGYRDGFKTGASDARKGESYNPERSHYFHDAGFGNFAGAYREGFARGYHDAFRT
jgi:hypothetical protein